MTDELISPKRVDQFFLNILVMKGFDVEKIDSVEGFIRERTINQLLVDPKAPPYKESFIDMAAANAANIFNALVTTYLGAVTNQSEDNVQTIQAYHRIREWIDALKDRECKVMNGILDEIYPESEDNLSEGAFMDAINDNNGPIVTLCFQLEQSVRRKGVKLSDPQLGLAALKLAIETDKIEAAKAYIQNVRALPNGEEKIQNILSAFRERPQEAENSRKIKSLL